MKSFYLDSYEPIFPHSRTLRINRGIMVTIFELSCKQRGNPSKYIWQAIKGKEDFECKYVFWKWGKKENFETFIGLRNDTMWKATSKHIKIDETFFLSWNLFLLTSSLKFIQFYLIMIIFYDFCDKQIHN